MKNERTYNPTKGWRIWHRDEIRHPRNNRLYMSRLWIFQCPLFGIRQHTIHLSDQDRHLHDHPFDFVSIIYSGCYMELRERGVFKYKAPDINVKKAESMHRLSVISGPVKSIVFYGPKRREWGFKTSIGWVYWKKYLGVADG